MDIRYNTLADSVSFKIDHTNYCLNKFANENLLAAGLGIIGAGLIFYATDDNINGLKNMQEDLHYLTLVNNGDIEGNIIAQRKLEKQIRKKQQKNDVLTIAAASTVLIGSVLHIISYRWLKRAYVMPVNNGLAIGVKFKF